VTHARRRLRITLNAPTIGCPATGSRPFLEEFEADLRAGLFTLEF
jgi:hypothetical protein